MPLLAPHLVSAQLRILPASSAPPCRLTILSMPFLRNKHVMVHLQSSTNCLSLCKRWGDDVDIQLARPKESQEIDIFFAAAMIVSRATDVGLPLMNLVKMKAVPILRQLRLEEKLLRTSSDNWCIINDGTNHPTIVMGISGKPSELIELESALRDRIPVIKRFTGGGTVIVDDGTIFVTLICNKGAIPGLQPYPRPIMSWTGQLYGEVFHGCGDFHLRENDYAFGTRKFGGNAQSITNKNRWIHHTSFLWDYDAKNMEYLKLPLRAPNYRSARDHIEFICRMKEYVPSKSTFIERTASSLERYFSLKTVQLETINDPSEVLASSSTKLLNRQELEAARAYQITATPTVIINPV